MVDLSDVVLRRSSSTAEMNVDEELEHVGLLEEMPSDFICETRARNDSFGCDDSASERIFSFSGQREGGYFPWLTFLREWYLLSRQTNHWAQIQRLNFGSVVDLSAQQALYPGFDSRPPLSLREIFGRKYAQ